MVLEVIVVALEVVAVVLEVKVVALEVVVAVYYYLLFLEQFYFGG